MSNTVRAVNPFFVSRRMRAAAARREREPAVTGRGV
jgi:hypothetical protein